MEAARLPRETLNLRIPGVQHERHLAPLPELEELSEGRERLSSLPHRLKIVQWEEFKPEYDRHIGEESTSIVTFEDTSQFVFRKTVPAEQEFKTSADFVPPLAARVNGLGTYLARQLAKNRVHSRQIGTNQTHGFNLLHDAQATLHILNEDDRRQEQPGRQTSTPGESLWLGYSMGQMKALIALGLAPQMGRDIVASIGLDPCLGKRVNYRQELRNPACALSLLEYLTSEALEIPKGITHSLIHEPNRVRTAKRIGHLAGTVGLSPAYYSNIVDKWRVLATGETGKYMDKIPHDAIIILHFFRRSHFNDNEFFESALGNHLFFRSIEEEGLHMTGARSSVVRAVAAHAKLALELREQGASREEIADALDTPVLSSAHDI